MPATETITKGFTMPCPCCGEGNANISLHLDDMTQFTCRECTNDFDMDQLREVMATWQKVMAWVDNAPSI